MLVLSRKVNDRIIIRDDIVVTVISIDGHRVRLGIEAPPNVSVHRQEIYERLKQGEEPKHGDKT